MSEWFYIKQLNESREDSWTLIDSNYNLYLPKDEFVSKNYAEKLENDIKQKNYKNNIFYRIVHKDSCEYKKFLIEYEKEIK